MAFDPLNTASPHDGSEGSGAREPLLRMVGVSKRFPGVQALDDVSLELGGGEVLGLIGENGAGKSTLIKVLAGIHTPERGEVFWQGRRVEIDGVQASLDLGIGVIHQELNLADNISIAENIFLGRQPSRFGWLGVVDRRRLHRMAQEQLDKLGLRIPSNTRLGRLTIGQRQLVEIAKALSLDARLLVFDEPTSSLSSSEAAALFDVIRRMKAQGVGILYVSHRLAEVEDLADRVQVLRDGKVAGLLSGEEIEHGRMVRLMVGRDVERYYQHERRGPAGDVVLRLRDVVLAGGSSGHGGGSAARGDASRGARLSVEFRAGEIVGFAGLVGAGRSELARAIFGIDRIASGTVELDGKVVRIGDARAAIRRGIGLVPEDRKQQGLILDMAITPNITMAGLCEYNRLGLLDRRRELSVARNGARGLDIRATSLAQKTRTLSGGNQQKVVLARWLAMDPRVLILDEPTRGVDVGCKSEIYTLMSRLAERGVAIWMISSEMEELLAMSDRVVVMHEGRIAGELSGEGITEEGIMTLAVGGDVPSARRNVETSKRRNVDTRGL
ncbi:MAG: sugar ABC transporter ATP-binding protein [Phycisphaerae bacterium]|nr:sugar ABC transporter ATP-binding protein [Phycisphaerae bacterium]